MKRYAIATLAILLLTIGADRVNAAGPQRGVPPPGAPGINVGSGGGPGGGPGMGPGDPRALAEYLSLTDEQKSAWQAIQEDLRATVDPLREQERSLRAQLDATLEGGDATAIGNLMLRIRTVRDQIKAAHDAAHNQFSALLTAEQKTKFDAFQAAVAFLRGRGPGAGPGPGPGRP